jgi:hypothetical protein
MVVRKVLYLPLDCRARNAISESETSSRYVRSSGRSRPRQLLSVFFSSQISSHLLLETSAQPYSFQLTTNLPPKAEVESRERTFVGLPGDKSPAKLPLPLLPSQQPLSLPFASPPLSPNCKHNTRRRHLRLQSTESADIFPPLPWGLNMARGSSPLSGRHRNTW